MRPFLYVSATFLALSACAPQQGGPRGKAPIQFAKNPTVILALDIAQSREAQEEGAYTALRDTAADNAVIFIPEPVEAREWLKDQPPVFDAAWQPHAVYISCDGKTGITTGAAQWGGDDGYYTTVWQYFEKGNGSGDWKWVLSHGDMVETPRTAPEFLQTKSASCDGKPTAQLSAPAEGVQMKQGFSYDQSLSWNWQYRPDKSRTLTVNLWNGQAWEKAFADNVKAP